ncbi:MAG TPA: hypothetical protein VGI27_02620 [Solirubrobacteraceae bacterium]
MKRSFQALPGVAGRARPIVDLVVEGLELAPQACLLDTGASDVRMGEHVAELAGIELARTLSRELVIGGLRTTGRAMEVQLELRQGAGSHTWTPTVYFCDPWPLAFGLLGLAGLDPFRVIIDTYEEWVELLRSDR